MIPGQAKTIQRCVLTVPLILCPNCLVYFEVSITSLEESQNETFRDNEGSLLGRSNRP